MGVGDVRPHHRRMGEAVNEAAEVLTAHGFRLLARADEARPVYRPGLIAAALVAFTDAEHGHPTTSVDVDHMIQKGERHARNQ